MVVDVVVAARGGSVAVGLRLWLWLWLWLWLLWWVGMVVVVVLWSCGEEGGGGACADQHNVSHNRPMLTWFQDWRPWCRGG